MSRKSSFLIPSVLIFTIALSFSACKKDNNQPYYIRFKANGVQKEFTVQSSLLATKSVSAKQNLTVITGYTATSNMNLNIFGDTAATVGTYTGYDISTTTYVLSGVQISYMDDNGISYTESDNTGEDVIELSEITNTTVSGKFHGVVKKKNEADVTITDGEFVVKKNN